MKDNLASYRHIEKKDYRSVCEILNENIIKGGTTLWNRTFDEVGIQQTFAKFTEREQAFLVELKHEIIGWGMIKKYHEKEGYQTTCETSVFFKAIYTNQGYGSSFKQFLISKCKDLGYHHICAKILATNAISIAYNQKLGYTIVGVQKEVGRVNGKWVDVVIMQLLI